MTEATEGLVKITDISPSAFRHLLNIIYTGDVGKDWGEFAEELIYSAEKYELKVLKEYLCLHIGSVLTLQNVLKIREFAKFHSLQNVLDSTKKFVMENFDEFLESVKQN